MEEKTKFEEIKELLKDAYGDRISERALNSLAKQLHYTLFVEKSDLTDIFGIVCEFECEEEIEDSESDYVFNGALGLLENCEDTARRLYNAFMYAYDSFDAFLKLYYENNEFISAEELKKAKGKALKIFDRYLMECCGITEDD